jgi:hypothetical protein
MTSKTDQAHEPSHNANGAEPAPPSKRLGRDGIPEDASDRGTSQEAANHVQTTVKHRLDPSPHRASKA